MMTLLYFGRLTDVFETREERLALPENVHDIEGLKAWLVARHEHLVSSSWDNIKITVNQILTHDNLKLKGDEEIGFLPPVGGG